jgi:hypothetical protein
VSIFVATSDAHGTPDATRAFGVEVVGPTRLRILVSAAAHVTHANMVAGRPGALLVTDITTYRSLQWKGTLVGPVTPRTPRDLALVDQTAEAFADSSAVVGLDPAECWRLQADEFVAVELEVTELFDQTPGPGGGAEGERVSTLAELTRCFEGEVPSMLATADAEGVPNLGHISQVFLVDDQHVAISNQFLAKSARNLAVNPLAVMIVVDPDTLCSFKLFARYLRNEASGPTFESVKRSIDAIAALSGMSDVFALKGVEVFRVLDVQPVPTRGSPSA